MKQEIWFKRKTYGWGWVPSTWQGWVVLAVYLVLVIAAGLTVTNNPSPQDVAFTFILPVTLLTAALIRICYRMGEKPRWQWGEYKNKNS